MSLIASRASFLLQTVHRSPRSRRRWPAGARSRGLAFTACSVRPRLDWRRLREAVPAFAEDMARRQPSLSVAEAETAIGRVLDLRARLVRVETSLKERRYLRNELAEKSKGGSPRKEDMERGKEVKAEITGLEDRCSRLEKEIHAIAMGFPNWLDEQAPLRDSLNSDENGIVVRTGGSKVEFEFDGIRDHVELAEALDMVDFKSPTITSGARFVALKNRGVFLEFALVQFALSVLNTHGFEAMMTPELVHADVIEGCGFNPKGEHSHVYHVHAEGDGHKDSDLCLAGTSEIALAGSQANVLFRDAEKQLPKRLAGFSHCFRAEAGGGGAFGRGLYRLHQFSKVEMFIFCHPSESETEFERLVAIQEEICDHLKLQWRTVDMYPDELGGPAARKFDIEAFMPSRCGYGELASISNCTDFQARRLNIRYINESQPSDRGFVHTLNGTALAVPRVMLALLETHQRADGSVLLPECLSPFLPKEMMELS